MLKSNKEANSESIIVLRPRCHRIYGSNSSWRPNAIRPFSTNLGWWKKPKVLPRKTAMTKNVQQGTENLRSTTSDSKGSAERMQRKSRGSEAKPRCLGASMGMFPLHLLLEEAKLPTGLFIEPEIWQKNPTKTHQKELDHHPQLFNHWRISSAIDTSAFFWNVDKTFDSQHVHGIAETSPENKLGRISVAKSPEELRGAPLAAGLWPSHEP